MKNFVQRLLHDGVAQTASLHLEGAAEAIEEFDDVVRSEVPGRAPVVDLDAAKWAFSRLHTAIRVSVDRSISESELPTRFATAVAQIGTNEVRLHPPTMNNPTIAYSVDLAFRFLPDLFALARRSLRDDPVLIEIRGLARDWPLSSVGIPDVEVPRARLDSVRRDPALRGLYIDRVIARGDTRRVGIDWVRAGVLAAFGAALTVPPEFARAFELPLAAGG